MKVPGGILACLVAAGAVLCAGPVQSRDTTLPHLVHNGGRHALIVDGEPFLILGAQTNNSSAWPARSPRPARRRTHCRCWSMDRFATR
jgi:hypothetical protein